MIKEETPVSFKKEREISELKRKIKKIYHNRTKNMENQTIMRNTINTTLLIQIISFIIEMIVRGVIAGKDREITFIKAKTVEITEMTTTTI